MKTITNKIFTLSEPIYGSTCDIIVGDEEYFKKVLKKNKISGYEINPNWIAETGVFDNENGTRMGYYIRIPEIDFTSQNYETIVHELGHLAFHIFRRQGG